MLPEAEEISIVIWMGGDGDGDEDEGWQKWRKDGGAEGFRQERVEAPAWLGSGFPFS